MLQTHAFAGQIPALQISFIGSRLEDSVSGSRNSLTESLRTEIADLRKIVVMSNPTIKSGKLECVMATRIAAKKTLVFAMISFREHNHVDRMFISSDLCLDKKNRQLAFAARARRLI